MTDDTVDFAALTRAAFADDKVAYRKLLQETSRFLRPFLSRILNNEGDREDVLQEILISIHKARSTYDGNRPYKPWAYAIAKFRLNDFLRKRYADRLRRSVGLEEAENIPDNDVTKSAFAYESIHELLHHVSEKQAAILQLLHREGLTSKEAALKLGMKESAVKVTAHRAYKILRKKLMEE